MLKEEGDSNGAKVNRVGSSILHSNSIGIRGLRGIDVESMG